MSKPSATRHVGGRVPRRPHHTMTRKLRSVSGGREAHGKDPRPIYAAGLRARPALLGRGTSRRITIMRFRPANIRVINFAIAVSATSDAAHSGSNATDESAWELDKVEQLAPEHGLHGSLTVLPQNGFVAGQLQTARNPQTPADAVRHCSGTKITGDYELRKTVFVGRLPNGYWRSSPFTKQNQRRACPLVEGRHRP
jgi:hypothetical protein